MCQLVVSIACQSCLSTHTSGHHAHGGLFSKPINHKKTSDFHSKPDQQEER